MSQCHFFPLSKLCIHSEILATNRLHICTTASINLRFIKGMGGGSKFRGPGRRGSYS